MADGITMSDLPLESVNGCWTIKVGQQRSVVPVDMFRVKLKAAMMNVESCKERFGADSRITRKAIRTYNFYYNQIDQKYSDVFALMMYPTSQWEV